MHIAQRYTLISPILAEDEFNKNIKSYILKLKTNFLKLKSIICLTAKYQTNYKGTCKPGKLKNKIFEVKE